MYVGEIYLTVDDLMKLMGNYSRTYAQRKHRQLRKEAGKGSHGLTIGDYCRLSGDDYAEIYAFLRGEIPKWLSEAG